MQHIYSSKSHKLRAVKCRPAFGAPCSGLIATTVYGSRVFGVGGQVGTSGEQRAYSNTFN